MKPSEFRYSKGQSIEFKCMKTKKWIIKVLVSSCKQHLSQRIVKKWLLGNFFLSKFVKKTLIYNSISFPFFLKLSYLITDFFFPKQSFSTMVSLQKYPPSSWGVRSVAYPSGNWGCPVKRSASPWSGSESRQGHPHISQPFMNTR